MRLLRAATYSNTLLTMRTCNGTALEGARLQRCIARNSRSQFHEDRKLLRFLELVPPCERTFVELGALDGVWLSNTMLYERCLGWNGLLIEASPVNFEKMKSLSLIHI